MFTSPNRKPWRAGLVTAAVACLTLTACGGGAQPESAGQGGSGGQDSGSGYPRTISHAMGETTIESKPKTVAALDSSYVDAALALGVEVAAHTKFPVSGDKLPKYIPDSQRDLASNAKVVGTLTSPNVEKLYTIKPDLVVSAKVRHQKIYDELSNVAPTIFSETTGATWKQNIKLLAKAVDKEKLAAKKISAYEQRAAAIGKNIREKLGHPATVSLVRFVEGEPTVRLYSSNSFAGIVLFDDVGLQRPKQQPNPGDKIMAQISQEEITKLDADHIFVSTYTSDSMDKKLPKDEFQSNPLWKSLQGEITGVSDTSWFTSVSLQGANKILTDLANAFNVDPELQK